jgi:DNA-binding MarR family transcriptional regulator
MQDKSQALLYCVNTFLKLRSRMPLRGVQAFLLVARNPGLSVSDLARHAGVPISTMSKDLRDIGEETRAGEPGLGLVSSRAEGPERLYFLTSHGQGLLTRLLELL